MSEPGRRWPYLLGSAFLIELLGESERIIGLRSGQLVLRSQGKVRGIMALVKLIRERPPGAIHYSPPFDSWSLCQGPGPAPNMGVGRGVEEFCGVIHSAGVYGAIPGPDGDVGDTISLPHK